MLEQIETYLEEQKEVEESKPVGDDDDDERYSVFLASDSITVADFSIFNEVANVLALLDLSELDDQKHPYTAAWFNHIN